MRYAPSAPRPRLRIALLLFAAAAWLTASSTSQGSAMPSNAQNGGVDGLRQAENRPAHQAENLTQIFLPSAWWGERSFTTRGTATPDGGARETATAVTTPAGPDEDEWDTFGVYSAGLSMTFSPDGGDLWLASNAGVMRWNVDAQTAETFGPEDGPISGGTWGVAHAPDGSVWLVAEDGVSRRTDAGWETYTLGRPGSWRPQAVAVSPSGQVVVGGWGGLAQFNGDAAWQAIASAPPGPVYDLAFGPDGTLWVTTSAGVHRRAPNGTWKVVPSSGDDAIPGADRSRVVSDGAGGAWVGGARFSCSAAAPMPCGWVAHIRADGDIDVVTPEDGLGTNAVHAIAHQPGGDVWIGGSSFLNELSGIEVQGLTRLGPDGGLEVIEQAAGQRLDKVLALQVDPEGQLWVLNAGHLLRRDLAGTWDAWSLTEYDDLPLASAGAIFDSVEDETGRHWFGTIRGVVLREPDGRFYHYSLPGDPGPAQFVEAVAVDLSGDLWVGSRGMLMKLRVDGSGEGQWIEPLGGPQSTAIRDIAVAPDGGVWVATYGSGAYYRNPDSGAWTAYTDLHLPGSVNDVEVAPDGTAWMAVGEQIAVVTSRSAEPEILAAPNAPVCQIRDITIEPDGTVWFGPNGFGCNTVSRRDPDGSWHHLPPATGHHQSSVSDIAIDAAGNVWFASWDRAGLSVLLGDGSWRRFLPPSGMLSSTIQSLTASVGPDGQVEIWLGSHNGVSRLRPAGAGSAGPSPTLDPTGAATTSTTPAHTLTPGTSPPPTLSPTPRSTATLDLPVISGDWRYLTDTDGVTGLAYDSPNGTLWAASPGGLVKWDLNTGDSRKFTVADGFPRNAVSSMVLHPSGRLWLGFRGSGVAALDPASGSLERFDATTGLLDDDALSLAVAPDGSLWVGSGHGASRRLPDGRWETFSRSDVGLRGTVVDLDFDADGRGYFGTYASGLSIRDPDGAWRSVTQLGGLGFNQVMSVEVDPDGQAWVSTFGFEGQDTVAKLQTVRADGTVSPVELPEALNDPARARFGPSGEVWLISRAGLFWRGPDGTWTRERVLDEGESHWGDLLIADDGTVWVGTREGVARRRGPGDYESLSPRESSDELPDNWISRVGFDSAGRPLVAGMGELFTQIEDGAWEPIRGASGSPVVGVRDFAVVEDSLWVSAETGLHHRAASGNWLHYTTADGLVSKSLGEVWLRSDSEVWVAGRHEPQNQGQSGVSHRRSNGVWESFTASDGLAPGDVLAFAQGGDGTIWLGMDLISGRTPPYNLSRRRPGRAWEPMSVPGSRENVDVRAAATTEDGTVWFATSLGVASISPDGTWTTWSDDRALAFYAESIRVDPDGNLWFTSRPVRVRWEAGGWAMVEKADLAMSRVNDIGFAPSGDIWFAGEGVAVLTPR